MNLKSPQPLLLALILLFFCLNNFAQNSYNLNDARKEGGFFRQVNQLIESRPKEVLFGIDISPEGDVIFSMSNKEWFDKIFALADGITADIISKDNYDCNKSSAGRQIPKGYVIQPLYRQNFNANLTVIAKDYFTLKIGKLPASMKGKELEANLVILSGKNICYYTNFVNIDRSVWDILPMGLYTDTLLQSYTSTDTSTSAIFNYTRKVQVIVPFVKGKTTYNKADIQPLYDSLTLKNYVIRKIDIRAYASVEGTEATNKVLMTNRAAAMVKALQQIDNSVERMKINAAENWIEFLQDIQNSPFADLSHLAKNEVKAKLMDKQLAAKLEPILSKERKAIVTIYMDTKTGSETVSNQNIAQEFKTAVAGKNIQKARSIQKEILERIADKRLPESYLSELEVPMEASNLMLINDREVYKYLFKLTAEYEALEVFKELKQKYPGDGRINYNLCALTILQWRAGDTANVSGLLKNINQLPGQQMDDGLVKRLLINYNILVCPGLMANFKYDEKDKAILFIKNAYSQMSLTDEDIYSLAKYFAYYSHHEWAEEIISSRIDKIDVSEDILFYYVNLGFYHPAKYSSENFSKALLNASTLNKERFCNFFTPNDKGGASLQLLDHEILKKVWCEVCSITKQM
ncbi:hypothetical protein [Pinibacter soli]|uniref:Uncharacterized protein n=1 Tax=Pinibacter soli TaxID=3044211 RepID=A0ABT6RF77_9BACT|nr:hypothetical protein [Pinibacter soli]MDI3320507.1 hypothetical protein [Pinibacter soli]